MKTDELANKAECLNPQFNTKWILPNLLHAKPMHEKLSKMIDNSTKTTKRNKAFPQRSDVTHCSAISRDQTAITAS